MNANELQLHRKGDGIYNTEPYHLEKYVVPGAVAVAFLFIFPWYLIGGKGIGAIDLGAAIIAVLVVGHVIEALKVYQWDPKVKVNFKTFNAKVEGLLSVYNIKTEQIDQAKAVLFSKLDPSEISGFAWNLVRWQKMTVFAALLFLSAIEWVLFAVLAILECKKVNPFATTFQLAFLKDGTSVRWSVVGEFVLAVVVVLIGCFVYKYGLDRQVRNNNFFFQLFVKYHEQIAKQLGAKISMEKTKHERPQA